LLTRRKFLRTSTSTAIFGGVLAKPSRAWLPVDEEKLVRARLAADPLRPQFHLLPAKNWMNDPNGPIYWKGRYHMFFQYNPNAAVWGDMHWAHAVSEDMVHWRHLPVALAPTPGWDDADGCFTGSAVDDQGTATILYTGVKTVSPKRATLHDGVHNFREVQCLATSTDPQLRTWTKWKTPVIEPPTAPDLMGFRDPFLWRDADSWYLGVASGHRKQGGSVLLYRSKNLREWEYLHVLTQGQWTGREAVNPVDSGEMWECPDFFPLAGKHVLLYSTAGGVYWESGNLDPKELVFHGERRGILDHGAYYAQKTQLSARGDRILWGWIPEKRPDDELRAAGWAGCMALPRMLSLNPEGELEIRFAPELQALRRRSFPTDGFSTEERVEAAQRIEITDVCGEFFWSTRAAQFELILADEAGIWFGLAVDLQDAASKVTVNGNTFDLPPTKSPQHNFQLFLDASVAELIWDSKHVITTRIYRKPDGPLRVSRASSFVKFSQLSMWQLRGISDNRLTT
jgi:beta-fructofuranosidase